MDPEQEREKSENEKSEEVKIDGISVEINGKKGEKVSIGPGGIHVLDGDDEVRVGWDGIRIRDGRTRLRVSFWKPLVGCAVFVLLFAAALTALVVGIVRLMLR